jgi:hypothetical protein
MAPHHESEALGEDFAFLDRGEMLAKPTGQQRGDERGEERQTAGEEQHLTVGHHVDPE